MREYERLAYCIKMHKMHAVRYKRRRKCTTQRNTCVGCTRSGRRSAATTAATASANAIPYLSLGVLVAAPRLTEPPVTTPPLASSRGDGNCGGGRGGGRVHHGLCRHRRHDRDCREDDGAGTTRRMRRYGDDATETGLRDGAAETRVRGRDGGEETAITRQR